MNWRADPDHLFAAHLADGDSLGIPRASHVIFSPAQAKSEVTCESGCSPGFTATRRAECIAAVELLERLHADPERARGYELFVYPVMQSLGLRGRVALDAERSGFEPPVLDRLERA